MSDAGTLVTFIAASAAILAVAGQAQALVLR